MQFTLQTILATIALVPAVSAHGYISNVVVNGKSYLGSNPNWYYQPTKPQQAGWYAMNQDNGFVSPDSYGSSDIACHKSATPGTLTVPVAAGGKVTLQWNTWPDTHHGPVIDYLAKCANNDCTKATASSLSWTKIDAGGLVDDTSPPGKWASDTLISKGDSWDVTIPSSLAPGQYVLRHEIIALHSAGSANGAQNYPQCINLQVTGSGSTNLPSGTAGTALYKSNDPGILINIYSKLASYTIPGPSVWAAKKKRDFTA